MIRAPLSGLVLALACAGAAAAEPMLFAAASTAAALDACIAGAGARAVTSYGASGTLARQIEAGAPADVFVSANPDWMAHLQGLSLVDPAAVAVLMSNRLVVIGATTAPDLDPAGMAARLDGEAFAMADPQAAPVGAYGQAALAALGLWDAVAPHLVPTRNTLATVAAVASGEAALGLVYASAAQGQDGVRVLWQVPRDSHPPILYQVAALGTGDDAPGGAALVALLRAPACAGHLAAAGFLPGPEGG